MVTAVTLSRIVPIPTTTIAVSACTKAEAKEMAMPRFSVSPVASR